MLPKSLVFSLPVKELLLRKSLCGKCPNMDFFSGPYFPVFRPEKTPYLETFHAMVRLLLRANKGKTEKKLLERGKTG